MDSRFSTTSDLDFYQNINFGGNAYSFLDYCQFEYGLDGSYSTPSTNPELVQQPHDGFIASFDLQFQSPEGIAAPKAPSHDLVVMPLPMYGSWSVLLPGRGDWTVAAYNAAGQKVGLWHSSGPSLVVDLSVQAPGMYLLRASVPGGGILQAKVVRP